jgi:uncharacterized membrane protein YgcG
MIAKLGRSLVLTVLCCLAVAGTASAATLRGVVVHKNHHAHSFVVSLKGGHLASVHARHSPRLGRTVRIAAAPMHNGTWLAKKVSVGRSSRHATLRGVVTFVDRRHGEFTLSANGASVLIHRLSRAQRAGVADASPTVGQNMTVEAGIDDRGDLEEESSHDNGAQTSGIELEGVVTGISGHTLQVSADDDNESGQTVTVTVPATFDMTAFTVGQEVKLLVTRQADNTFLLQGSAEDDNSNDANNPSDSQGRGGGSSDDGGSPGDNGGVSSGDNGGSGDSGGGGNH